MFKNIVWASDGSEHADRAYGYACALALAHRSHLHVVHVIEKLVGGRSTGENMFLDEDRIRAKVDGQATQAREQGIQTSFHAEATLGSDLAHQIATIADGAGAELIVVGTRGHTALGGLVLGSVTQQLLHVSRCPVLAVPPHSPALTEADTSAQLSATS